DQWTQGLLCDPPEPVTDCPSAAHAACRRRGRSIRRWKRRTSSGGDLLFGLRLTQHSVNSAQKEYEMSHRRDLNALSIADRNTLVGLMLNYINDAVVAMHNPNNPGSIVHHMGEHAFITHRNFIGDLEAWLMTHGGARFVPLPSWNPANPIPAQFNVVK